MLSEWLGEGTQDKGHTEPVCRTSDWGLGHCMSIMWTVLVSFLQPVSISEGDGLDHHASTEIQLKLGNLKCV